MDLEELKFFEKEKELEDVFEEFGRLRGANLLKEVIEEGFVEKEEEFFKLSKAGEKKIGMESEETKGKLKIFLSYSSLDYDIAKQIKDFLEEFGMEVFLAHTSIEPTKAWEEEIYKSLKECDMFIPLLTENFKSSNWTDQECGIAYNEGKKIISIKITSNPYGFLGKFQALRADISKWNWKENDTRVKLIHLINEVLPLKTRECILNSLETTRSWIIGKTKFKMLKEKEPFSEEEINKIMEKSIGNSQIYGAEGVKEYLSELIEKYGDKIESGLKDEVIAKIENDKARAMLGGETEAGFPILYGSPEQKLEQLKGYGGQSIEEMREELKREIEKEKKPALVDGLRKHL